MSEKCQKRTQHTAPLPFVRRGQVDSSLMFDLHSIDRAGEGVLPGIVVIAHGRIGVLANVSGLASQRPDRTLRLVDASFANFLAVDRKHASAAFVQATTVI